VAAARRVIVLSLEPTMTRLLSANLQRRGFEVQPYSWAACCGLGEVPRRSAADILLADLHCPAPQCWDAGPRLRKAFADTPLLLLAHELASAAYLQRHHPCECLQKPFSMTDALRAIQTLMNTANEHAG
jgi:DNA-binding response OmpR family regulator